MAIGTAKGKDLFVFNSQTKEDALKNSENTGQLHFPTDSDVIVFAGKEYGNNEKVANIESRLDDLEQTATIDGTLNLKSYDAIVAAQALLTKHGESKTFVIADSNGNFPTSEAEETVYLDDEGLRMDLLFSVNGTALKYFLQTRQAYYTTSGSTWYSQNIENAYITIPNIPMQTAKVGDLVTIYRYELDAGTFYDNYINFSAIEIGNTTFDAYKEERGYGSSSDGEFLRVLITDGEIYSCLTNPNDDKTTLSPLAVYGKVVLYTAQITPNINRVYSGNFESGDITAAGIYSYVTSDIPSGDANEYYIGYVSPDGTLLVQSMKDPANVYMKTASGWQRKGVGMNTGGTGEIFNDYSGNEANANYAHAEGHSTNALGVASHAEGMGTSTDESYAHVEGMYNKPHQGAIHEVGIGTSEDTRFNAHTIMKDGSHYIYGVGGYDGTDQSAASEGTSDLATVLNDTANDINSLNGALEELDEYVSVVDGRVETLTANLSNTVKLTGEQTVSGIKKFSNLDGKSVIQNYTDSVDEDTGNKIVTEPLKYNSLAAAALGRYVYHDILAFNADAIQSIETATTLGEYTALTGDALTEERAVFAKLFAQKENQYISLLNKNKAGVRFTINNSWAYLRFLVVEMSSVAPLDTKIIVERKDQDREDYRVVARVQSSAVGGTLDCIIPLLGERSVEQILRITFELIDQPTADTTGGFYLNAIRLLTSRNAAQGLGKENEYPYTWDENKKMFIPALDVNGQLNAKGALSVTGNTTIGGGLSVTGDITGKTINGIEESIADLKSEIESTDNNLLQLSNSVVKKTGDQTIDGVKKFSKLDGKSRFYYPYDEYIKDAEGNSIGIYTSPVDLDHIGAMELGHYIYHDIFAFQEIYPIAKYETASTDGVYTDVTSNEDYSTLRNNLKVLFDQKETSRAVILNNEIRGLRLTLGAAEMNHASLEYLIIGTTYAPASGSKVRIKAETSNDDVTFTLKANIIIDADKNYDTIIPLVSYGHYNSCRYLRVTFEWDSMASESHYVHYASIRGLSARNADQALGKENEYPYTWDENKKMTMRDVLVTQSAQINGQLNVTGNITGKTIDALNTAIGNKADKSNAVGELAYGDYTLDYRYVNGDDAPSLDLSSIKDDIDAAKTAAVDEAVEKAVDQIMGGDGVNEKLDTIKEIVDAIEGTEGILAEINQLQEDVKDKSTVSYDPKVYSGTVLGEITINGTSRNITAPNCDVVNTTSFTVTADGWYRLATIPSNSNQIGWKDKYILVNVVNSEGNSTSASFKVLFNTQGGWAASLNNEFIVVPLTYTNYVCITDVRYVHKEASERYIDVYVTISKGGATKLQIDIKSNMPSSCLPSTVIAGLADTEGYNVFTRNAHPAYSTAVGGLVSEKVECSAGGADEDRQLVVYNSDGTLNRVAGATLNPYTGNLTVKTITSDSKSKVTYTQSQTSGKELGTITIDGTSKKIYAPSTISGSNVSGGVLDFGTESSNGIVPSFLFNDLAFIRKRSGSSVKVFLNGVERSLSSVDNLFDGSPAFCGFPHQTTINGEVVAVDSTVIEIISAEDFSYVNRFYIHFVSHSFNARGIKFEICNTKYTSSSSWVTVKDVDDFNENTFHSTFDPRTLLKDDNGAALPTYNGIRITLTNWKRNDESGRRIAEIGVVDYNSEGARRPFMSRGADDPIYRGITPAKNVTYDLGSNVYKWRQVFAESFQGKASKVVIQQGGTDVWRPLLQKDANDNVLFNQFITANFATGNLKVPSINIDCANANALTIRRTNSSGGAFIEFHPVNSDTDYWRVGATADKNFGFAWRNNLVPLHINSSGQLVSTNPTGTAPFVVTSTTKVTNLNADLLDGMSYRYDGRVEAYAGYIKLLSFRINTSWDKHPISFNLLRTYDKTPHHVMLSFTNTALNSTTVSYFYYIGGRQDSNNPIDLRCYTMSDELDDDGNIIAKNYEVWCKGNSTDAYTNFVMSECQGLAFKNGKATIHMTEGTLPDTTYVSATLGSMDVTASYASKMTSNNVGNYYTPVYFASGRPVACTMVNSSNYWGGLAYVASNGGMEIGKFIDFHTSDTDTSDYAARIIARDSSDTNGAGLTLSGTTVANGVFTGKFAQYGGFVTFSADMSNTTNKYWGKLWEITESKANIYINTAFYCTSQSENKHGVLTLNITAYRSGNAESGYTWSINKGLAQVFGNLHVPDFKLYVEGTQNANGNITIHAEIWANSLGAWRGYNAVILSATTRSSVQTITEQGIFNQTIYYTEQTPPAVTPVTVVNQSLSQQAASATKLATPRIISLGNFFEGSEEFDGSENITINGAYVAKQLSNETDLNTLLHQGKYYAKANHECDNLPSNVHSTTPFSLFIEKMGDGYWRQDVTASPSSNQAVHMYRFIYKGTTTTTYSDWKSVDTTYSVATTSTAGLMSANDKVKVNSIEDISGNANTALSTANANALLLKNTFVIRGTLNALMDLQSADGDTVTNVFGDKTLFPFGTKKIVCRGGTPQHIPSSILNHSFGVVDYVLTGYHNDSSLVHLHFSATYMKYDSATPMEYVHSIYLQIGQGSSWGSCVSVQNNWYTRALTVL